MNNFIISESNDFNIQKMIDIALNEKLYIEGFDLYKVLNNLKSFKDESLKINLLYINKTPSGIALYTMYEPYNLQVFVKEHIRRNGYGKILVESLIKRLNNKEKLSIKVGIGIEESYEFWGNLVEKELLNKKSVSFYELIEIRKEARLMQEKFFSENNIERPLLNFIKEVENK